MNRSAPALGSAEKDLQTKDPRRRARSHQPIFVLSAPSRKPSHREDVPGPGPTGTDARKQS